MLYPQVLARLSRFEVYMEPLTKEVVIGSVIFPSLGQHSYKFLELF